MAGARAVSRPRPVSPFLASLAAIARLRTPAATVVIDDRELRRRRRQALGRQHFERRRRRELDMFVRATCGGRRYRR